MANQIKKDNEERVIKSNEQKIINKYLEQQANIYKDLIKLEIESESYIHNIKKAMQEIGDESSEEYKKLQAQLEVQGKIYDSTRLKMKQMSDSLSDRGFENVVKKANDLVQDEVNAQAILLEQEAERAELLEKINELKSKKNLSEDESSELKNLKTKLKELKQQSTNSDEERFKLSGSLNKSSLLKDILNSSTSKGEGSKSTEVISSVFENKLGNASPIGKGITGLLTVTGKILDVTSAVRRSIDGWVDDAARVLANHYGKINASLEGATKDFSSISDNAVESLGLSRFVKQTDYIEQIARLTASGVSFNVEQRALLETIKDKTIASFDAVDGNLLRLIRLRQQDLTATQFGLEAALRTTLNKVFKDSAYLNELYDTINGAIMDAAIVSGSSDITEYNSTIQSWMGAMYESGVSSGVVQKLAQGINYLGSGNVAGLASDADLQRLILLSMDSINMDYADILQRGLSAKDINDLLTAIVKYLTQIAKNTSDNNVLASSYTNLFNMSMSDLKAITNLSNNLGSWSIVNSSSALAKTNEELSFIQSTERTTVAEQVQNIMDNAKYTFGQSIAKDAGSYLTWKVSNLMIDVFDSVVQTVGETSKLGKLAQTAKLVPEIGIFGNELKGILSIASAIGSMSWGNEVLNAYINGAPSYGGGNSTSVSAAVTSTGSNGTFKAVSMKDVSSSSAYTTASTQYSAADWASEEEISDEQLAELKTITSALVQSDAEDAHKAFATYLVGMTDDTLRSFASIFADEDAMNETFTGENSTLKDNLFKYAEDTTSNSTKPETKSV